MPTTRGHSPSTEPRRRCCSIGAISPRSTIAASASSAPATRPCPAARRADASARALSEAGVAVVSGLARGVDGAAHRGVLDGDGRPAGRRRRLWTRRRLPARTRRAVERGGRARRAAVRSPAGHGPRGPSVPAAQPCARRAERGARRRRVAGERRQSDHGPRGPRPRHHGDGGPGSPPPAGRRRAPTCSLATAPGWRSTPPTSSSPSGLDTRRAGRAGVDPRLVPQPADRRLLDLFEGQGLELEEVVARSGRPVGEVARRARPARVGRVVAGHRRMVRTRRGATVVAMTRIAPAWLPLPRRPCAPLHRGRRRARVPESDRPQTVWSAQCDGVSTISVGR